MPDYKEMYLKMVRASEQAINILIQAQQECEEMYISGHSRKETAPEPSDSPGAEGQMQSFLASGNEAVSP